MATVTILKHGDGIYTFSDYAGPAKASGTLADLGNSTVPFQAIHRRKDTPIEAYLVQASWYQAQVASFGAVSAAVFAANVVAKTDDYLGGNLSKMVNLLLGQAEVPEQAAETIELGFSAKAFLVYEITNTALAILNPNAVVMDSDITYGGSAIAYLLHPAHYNALINAPQATGYAGTGDGSIAVSQYPGFAIAETLTATCTAAAAGGGTFAIHGSTNGSYGSATVGTPFETTYFELLISAGAVDFDVGDEFTVTLSSAAFNVLPS